MTQIDPHRPADAEAKELAQRLLAETRDAVLATLDEDGWPLTSRIALQIDADGVPLALLSGLALHSTALRRDARAALLVDAVVAADTRGMPLTRSRLSLQVRAELVDSTETDALRQMWRARDPKSAVYLDLPDFRFWRLRVRSAMLNAGFGRASLLSADDLRP